MTSFRIFLVLLTVFALVVMWVKNRTNLPKVLRQRYYAAEEIVELLRQAKAAYGQDPSGKPIRSGDYLVLLDGFDRLLTFVDEVPPAYDMDFRRNLPAGGWRGLEVAADMKSRIRDVREFVAKHPVYPNTGESLVENLSASLNLIRASANVDPVLVGLRPVLQSVAAGNLRDEPAVM